LTDAIDIRVELEQHNGMKERLVLSLATLALATLVPVAGSAQTVQVTATVPPPPPPVTVTVAPQPMEVAVAPMPMEVAPAREEHSGFFFRGTVGPGYGRAAVTDVDLSVGGVGVGFRLEIGGSVMPNLAIYADLGGMGIPSPKVNYGGASGTSDSTLIFAGIGGGLCYYLMPVNLYIGTVFRALQLSVDDGSGTTSSSDIGFGASLMVGKEFWVGPRWSLGPALEIEYGRVPDNGVTWSVFSAAVTLSITRN